MNKTIIVNLEAEALEALVMLSNFRGTNTSKYIEYLIWKEVFEKIKEANK